MATAADVAAAALGDRRWDLARSLAGFRANITLKIWNSTGFRENVELQGAKITNAIIPRLELYISKLSDGFDKAEACILFCESI